jgi:DNA-binding MarR family transcriptional regulator
VGVADRDQLIGQIVEAQGRLQHLFLEAGNHPLLSMNLTMSQFKVMLILSARGGGSGNDLSAAMGVTLATLTGIVDRLVAQDLVSRREDPHDRRVRRLELTQAGAELVDRVITTGMDHQLHLLRRLSVADLSVVARATEIVLAAAVDLQIDPER